MRFSIFAEDPVDERRPDYDIRELLTQLSLPIHYRGYQFFVDALVLALEDEEYLFGVTKNLYPTIAKMHRSTAPRVERSMRHALEAAWNAEGSGLKQRLSGREKKPTNRELLALLYKWILEERSKKKR